MVIITLSFGIALAIISNVAGRNNPQLRFKALTEAQRVINLCKSTGNLDDQNWQVEGLTIDKVVKPFHEYQGVRQVEISVYNNSGRLLIHRMELINVPE